MSTLKKILAAGVIGLVLTAGAGTPAQAVSHHQTAQPAGAVLCDFCPWLPWCP